MADVKHILVPVSKKEAENPLNLKYDFAIANQDRWVDLDPTFSLEFSTNLDRGGTYFIHDDKVYMYYKDYLDYKNNRRLYIVKEVTFS